MKEQKRYIGGLILLMGVVIVSHAVPLRVLGLLEAHNSYGLLAISSRRRWRQAMTATTSPSCASRLDIHGTTLTGSITYLNTASFVVYLIPSYFKYRRAGSKSYQSLPSAGEGERISLPPSPRIPLQHEVAPEDEVDADIDIDALPRLGVTETARIAGWWALFWFLANWSLNISLAWTSVASVTILSSTSGTSTWIWRESEHG
jgi:solute carrier family 35 protein F5